MSYKNKILLIEDEEDIATIIKLQADLSGYTLHVEMDGLNGFRAIEKENPDLIILDIMLPKKNGFDVCRQIKNHPEFKNIPVIILSAKSEELDMILGLELGADDYVQKPFSPKVLFSRVKAVLRRKTIPVKSSKILSFGEFTLDVSSYVIKRNGTPITVTLSEFGILKRLIQQKGKVLTRNQLLNNVHNDDAFIIDRNIDVHIASLRKKLGPQFRWIETVRGVGYRFQEPSILPNIKTVTCQT